MSSVTNAVQVTNTSNKLPTITNNALGFETLNDYYRYLNSNENVPTFPLKHFDPFLKTTNPQVLQAVGKSQFIAKKTKEAIDRVRDPWNSNAIKEILKFLRHIPFELSTLIENELGYAVKDIKKAANSKNDTEIVTLSSKLINEWKELQTKATANTNGKRDSPDRSSNSPPPASETKKIKLAIQKEAPVRPKAIADLNFFPTTLGEKKKYRRPVYISESNPNNESTPFMNKIPESTAVTTTSTSSPTTNKKRVTFSEKLFEIREYEKNPEEWTIGENQAPEEIDRYYGSVPSQQKLLDVHPQPQFNVPTVDWYPPFVLSFNIDDCLVIPKAIHTPESLAQDHREKLVLGAIYTNPQHIPSSPGEPDEVPDLNLETRVIPLDDASSEPLEVYSVSPPVVAAQPIAPPVISSTPTALNPSFISPATLTALAAALNNDPKLLPPQQQQPQVVPKPQPVQQSTPVYTPIPFAAQQAEISNSTVESMLKNNPGIMNSLKQLSFLAASNSPSTLPIQPSNEHVAYNDAPSHYNNNNTHNRGNTRFNSGGRGGRGGKGRGGGIRKNNRQLCTFFSTSNGCKKGVQCPFSHDQ